MKDYIFRCSSLGKLLTDPRSNKDKEAGKLSKTTETYLKELFIEEMYGRRKEVETKYMKKGISEEDKSIDLLSRVTGKSLIKNTVRLQNDYISGEWDTTTDEKVVDIKSNWDVFTFGNAELTPDYIAQLNGYMWLLDVEDAELTYCLVDTPLGLIENELWYEKRKHGVEDLDDQHKYEVAKKFIYGLDAMSDIAKDLFPDADISDFIPIPEEDRVKTFTIKRDDALIDKLISRIEKSREVMSSMTL